MYKGMAQVTQRRSPNSLYSEEFATFGADDVYDQKHAEGFIRLFSLSSRITALKHKKSGEVVMALWGGRFKGKASVQFKKFNDSLPVDYRMAVQDIVGSIAWAQAIHEVGVLNDG